MHLLIPLADLGFLDLEPHLTEAERGERIRQHFGFLGETSVEIREGIVSITLTDAGQKRLAQADEFVQRATRRAREGDFHLASDLYRRALKLHPALPQAHRDLAMCLMELGQLDEARDELIDALKLHPTDAASFVVLANLYLKKQDYPQGERFHRRALELDPGNPYALNGLAIAHVSQGKQAEALALFDEATRLHPHFPNAWNGKARVQLLLSRLGDAAETLAHLFRQARPHDARSSPVFAESRRLFLQVQQRLAETLESDCFKAVHNFKATLENLSGFPIEFASENLPAGLAAQMKMAWKHQGRAHRLVIRHNYPPPLTVHLQLHELTHLQLEVEARAAGANRFFTVGPEQRRHALQALAPELRQLADKRAPAGSLDLAAEAMLTGLGAHLFNTPLDLLIERRLHRDFPAARPAQLLSLLRLSEEAAARLTLRKSLPAKVFRASTALAGAAALLLDDLSGGATQAWAAHAALDTAPTSRRLWELFLAREPHLAPGGEYALVDEFADLLGLRGWYAWQTDPGPGATPSAPTASASPLTRVTEEDLVREGSTNPGLLRSKHPAAVWHLLDSLQRFEKLDPAQARALTFEAALAGQEGLDYASPKKKYRLRSLPGETFSGLQMMCLMFVGLKRVMPGEDTQMDLEDPFLQALELYHHRKGGN